MPTIILVSFRVLVVTRVAVSVEAVLKTVTVHAANVVKVARTAIHAMYPKVIQVTLLDMYLPERFEPSAKVADEKTNTKLATARLMR